MIDFFLTPKRLKLLLVGGGALLAASVVLLICTIYLSGKLDTERAGHEATREKLATAVREGNRWKAIADAAEPKITALQGSLKECLAREAQATADAVDRMAIMEAAEPRGRTPVENKGVVDDATRKKAVDRLNRPL